MSKDSPQRSHSAELLPATLRRIRLMGHFSLLTTLVVFVIAVVGWGEPYSFTNIGQLIAAHILGGRAGNATLGLDYDIAPAFILFQACMQDFIIMFYAFPLFVTGLSAASNWPIVGTALVGIRNLAERHQERLAPYGLLGLLLFVVFPFWSTGPLVGVLVGYLLRLNVFFAFVAVMIGNVIAMSLWLWALEFVVAELSAVNENLPLLLTIGIVAATVAGGVWHRLKKRDEPRASGRSTESPVAE
jgi:hypothetical protein